MKPAKLPHTMQPSEINKELDRLDAKRSDLCDRMIDAGRGHERYSDYCSLQDPLSLAIVRVQTRQADLRSEIDRRYGPNAPSRLPKGFGPLRAAWWER